MRKILLSLLIAMAAAMAVPLSASAVPAKTDVFGTVTDNGIAVAHARVTVTCHGVVKRHRTNSSGAYAVVYRAKVCPVGSTVHVTAIKKHVSGSGSGMVSPTGNVKLNFAVVDVTVAVPEVGLITGTIAVAGAGGALLTIRRRKLVYRAQSEL